jgi:Predicted integral membrane protein
MDWIPWGITVFTVVSVYFLGRWEHKWVKSIFDWVPAILLSYIIPAIISHLFGWDFSQSNIHGLSKDFFIPLAIVAVMASLSLSQLKSIGYKPIVVFVAGSFFIALFPVLFVILFEETELVANSLSVQGYWRGVPPIVGSWIGGSTSQLVLKELVNCPEDVFLSVLVMDNILVNVWTILMFQTIKKSNGLNTILKITDNEIPEKVHEQKGLLLSPWWCVVLLLSTVFIINFLLKLFVAKVVILSFLGLAIGNFMPGWNFRFTLKLGGILILLVMSILGLKLQFALFGFDLSFFGFLLIWLLGHFVFMLMIAKLMNVNIAWVPIASMANVGGIATAPAVTSAYKLSWMPHAIILAILSMATGTFWGMLTIYLLQLIL